MKLMCPSADEAMARWWGVALPRRRQPRRHQGAQRDELADRCPRCRRRRSASPRSSSTAAPTTTSESRRAATSPSGSPAPALSSCREPITSSALDPDQILDVVEPFLAECGAARDSRGPRSRVGHPGCDRGRRRTLGASPPSAPTGSCAASSPAIAADGSRPLVIGSSRPSTGRRERSATPPRSSDAAGALGIEVRSGVHTGEVAIAGDRAHGVALDIAVGVAAAAAPGEVLVRRPSRTSSPAPGSNSPIAGAGRFPTRLRRRRLLAVLDPPIVTPVPSGGPIDRARPRSSSASNARCGGRPVGNGLDGAAPRARRGSARPGC